MPNQRMDEGALARIQEEAGQFIKEKLPDLAEAMNKAESETKHRGKLVITVDWSFKPGTENDPVPEEVVQIHAKLDTPKESTDAHKVAWNNGQMTLL